MILRAVTRQHAHGVRWCQAFAEGIARHRGAEGCGDLLVCWSARHLGAIEDQKRRGGEVCILECGYIGDRTAWTSVSLGGGLNGRGRFAPSRDGGDRFARLWLGHLKPWRHGGDYALICAQCEGDMAVAGVDLATVYADAAARCRRLGIEPLFRPHPKAPMAPPDGVAAQTGTLAEGLARAAFVVTWNSNAGVDAALAGVPVVALDRGSMAWEVAAHQVRFPERVNREIWAADLAWKQWTEDEIRSGMAWEHLKSALPRDRRQVAEPADHFDFN